MRWHVFVDLARLLDEGEVGAVSDALDELVPDGGATTPRNDGHELFFVVEAGSHADAMAIARRYASEVLAEAQLQIEHEVTVTPTRDSEVIR